TGDTMPLPEFSIWSQGGHLTASGQVTRREGDFDLDLNATLVGVRVEQAAFVTAVRQLQREAGLDGLVGGQFHITGTAQRPRVEGHTEVRLASAYGINIEKATANVAYEATERGPQVRVSELAGEAEGTPFSGAFAADY